MKAITRNTAFFSLSLIFFFCYYRGLSSAFLLDDYGNLNKLGDFNGIRNFYTFFEYLLNGIAGPTGRPISLLSFLIDSNTWPADPLPFKRTNILLHFFSGILLFFSIRNIASALDKDESSVFWTAMIAASIWLLHPFLVSTVLYAVQRMAMLAAFFTLLGVLGYSYGRQIIDNKPAKAYGIMTIAVTAGTVLAVLSKENGVLLPLFIFVIEKTVFSHPASRAAHIDKTWFVLFVVLPCLIILAYLFNQLINVITYGYGERPFTLAQRLLTETRIVVDYLHSLLVPQMLYPGLFYENYPLSNSLFDPVTTLAATALIIALPILAFVFRIRFPFFAVAIFFFYVGHLLESTFIPLELYFEHRNYLPAVFLFLPLGRCFVKQTKWVVKPAIVLYLVICAAFTYQTTSLWGKPLELAMNWAQQNQISQRAQRSAAILLEQNGKPVEGLNMLKNANANIPGSMAIKLHWLKLKCKISGVQNQEFNAINQQLPELNYTSRLFNLLTGVVSIISNSGCPGLDFNHAIEMLESLLKNPMIFEKKTIAFQMHHLKGQTYAQHNNPEQAAKEFATALDFTQRVEHGLLQTAILASNKHYDFALRHLDKTEKLYLKHTNPSLKEKLRNYGYEIQRLRNVISDDILNVSKK